MRAFAVRALRAVIAITLVGSLGVQAVLAPLLWLDLDGAPAGIRVAIVAIVVLGVGTVQVCAVSVWRLLTMVRVGTVFSHAAFRYVDVVIGAIATASVLTFGAAAVAVWANHTSPGDEIAPGLVALVCGAALVVAGVALIVLVQRMLLTRAVAMQTELGAVI